MIDFEALVLFEEIKYKKGKKKTKTLPGQSEPAKKPSPDLLRDQRMEQGKPVAERHGRPDPEKTTPATEKLCLQNPSLKPACQKR